MTTRGKTALIIGASKGLGRQIAVTMARDGYSVGICAKTEALGEVEQQILNEGKGKVLSMQCDSRDERQVANVCRKTKEHFGRIDVAIYNAGAIFWKKVVETSMKQFDLMHQVNMRGSYAMVQEVLPEMLEHNYGRIILVSPPIYSRFFKGKTPYAVTKCGMSVLTMGLSNELTDTNVAVTSLWPASVVDSAVTVGVEPRYMRKPDIFADACLSIANEETTRLNGQCVLDEDYLRDTGVTDFAKYRCDPDHEPPRMMPKKFPSLEVEEQNWSLDKEFKNGKDDNTKAKL